MSKQATRTLGILVFGAVVVGCTSYRTAVRQTDAQQYEAAIETLDREYPNSLDRKVYALRMRIEREMRATPDLRLRLAKHEFDVKAYADAEADFLAVLNSGVLTGTALSVARNGACEAGAQTANFFATESACAVADPTDANRQRLSAARSKVLLQYERDIPGQIGSGRLEDARATLRAYKATPGYVPYNADQFDFDIAKAEEEAKKRAEAQRLESLRRADAEEKERRQALKAARARLRETYGVVRGLSKRQFEAYIASARSALGLAIFAKVEATKKDGLSLWLNGPEFLEPNLRQFADFCDMYTVWCDCDGSVLVGLDRTYLGAGITPLMGFVFSSQTGACTAAGR